MVINQVRLCSATVHEQLSEPNCLKLARLDWGKTTTLLKLMCNQYISALVSIRSQRNDANLLKKAK